MTCRIVRENDSDGRDLSDPACWMWLRLTVREVVFVEELSTGALREFKR